MSRRSPRPMLGSMSKPTRTRTSQKILAAGLAAVAVAYAVFVIATSELGETASTLDQRQERAEILWPILALGACAIVVGTRRPRAWLLILAGLILGIYAGTEIGLAWRVTHNFDLCMRLFAGSSLASLLLFVAGCSLLDAPIVRMGL